MPGTPSELPKLRVVHLDDDPFELERVQNSLEKNALDCTFLVESMATVAAYKKRLGVSPRPDVAILDIHVGDDDTSGINLADLTRKMSPKTVILMCSTADDISTIAECLNSGADDFISKQSDKGELSLRVYNSYRLAKLKMGADIGPSTHDKSGTRPTGATMERISRRVPLIIESAITAVFIRGESGTGKEVVADLFGSRLPSNQPFVKVNCGAIAPTLLESELFGHVKGAFTGAMADKRGLLEAASGGWIFLDEVATLSASAQVALLRVLENQEVLRVGATKPVAINVRVISATNEPMEQLVRSGKFRSDLWQRLREAEVVLPPLRERPGEIKALVEYFCRSMPGGPYTVSGPVMQVLTNFAWKDGNIRELRNCLRAMTEMHINKMLTPLGIPERIWEELGEKPSSHEPPTSEESTPLATTGISTGSELIVRWDPSESINFESLTDLLLVELIRKMFREKGKLSLRGLAQAIGMSRSTLSTRLKGIVQRNVIDLADLSRMVGVSNE